MPPGHTKQPRAVLYARISTTEKRQNWRAQLQELRRVAQHRGWKVVAEYHDVTSGRNSKRPGLQAALAVCRAGGAEIFAAVDVDRIARSAVHFLNLLGNLDAINVQMSCTRDPNFDTTTPTGRHAVQMRAAYAELEGRLIGQRIKESLAIKRANGVKLGAPRRYNYRHLPSVLRLRRLKPPTPWNAIANRFGGSAGGWERAVVRVQTTKAAA